MGEKLLDEILGRCQLQPLRSRSTDSNSKYSSVKYYQYNESGNTFSKKQSIQYFRGNSDVICNILV